MRLMLEIIRENGIARTLGELAVLGLICLDLYALAIIGDALVARP